jgi:hypothetical protein
MVRDLRRGAEFSSYISDVVLGAEDFLQLTLVIIDVTLHDLHARPEKTLESLHIQDCNRLHHDNNHNLPTTRNTTKSTDRGLIGYILIK